VTSSPPPPAPGRPVATRGRVDPIPAPKRADPLPEHDLIPAKVPWISLGLAGLWVLIYLGMTIYQGGIILPLGTIAPSASHPFGDLTTADLLRGQVWRCVTATFIHFNILHLALNLLGLIQLGRLLESWYGRGPFLALYVVIGGLGNLIAALLRPYLDRSGTAAFIHCGGGSTVVMGLIGLVAVVGWRSRAEFEVNVAARLVAILLLNAVLGFALPNIDNLVHATGVVLGVLLGLGDATWLRAAQGPWARRAGAAAILVIAACVAAQTWADRAEAGVARRARVVEELKVMHVLYAELARRRVEPQRAILLRRPMLDSTHVLAIGDDRAATAAIRGELRRLLRQFRADAPPLDRGPTAAPYAEVVGLVSRALSKPPTPAEARRFSAAFRPLAERAVAARNADRPARAVATPRPASGDRAARKPGPVPVPRPARPGP